MNERFLVVNADDLGLSAGVDAGIAEARRLGIVTSASLMVDQRHAAEAVRWAAGDPGLSVGIHLDLCEWAFRNGAWVPRYQRVDTDDADAVAGEVARQLAAFERLVGAPPTHLDSHQHVHQHEPVDSIVRTIGERLGVPVRSRSAVRYVGSFYGQTYRGEAAPEWISVTALSAILAALEPGISELGCHPGFAEDTDDVYRLERRLEVAALCDPTVRAQLERDGIQLCSYLDVPTPRERVAP